MICCGLNTLFPLSIMPHAGYSVKLMLHYTWISYTGGEVIKQINAQSGAHCELDRRAQNNDRNNRTFYIRGHPEAVEHCKRIIMEKVSMVR